MYRRALVLISLVKLMFLWAYICICLVEEMNPKQNEFAEVIILRTVDETCMPPEIVAKKTDLDQNRGVEILQVRPLERPASLPVKEPEQSKETEEEVEILYRIVEAEAGGEDELGKLLVANVVLNRRENQRFPDTIREVVFQEENGVVQFSPVANGRYEEVNISEETKKAVNRALEGEDYSQGALYFVSREYAQEEAMQWFDNHLSSLFVHGNHEFFR